MKYFKVLSSKTFPLEAHAGFFKMLMKWILLAIVNTNQ